MGGNALKNVKTIRIDPINYHRIKTIIIDQLKSLGYIVSEIREVPGKESYGDMDLLWWHDPKVPSNIRKDVINIFKPNEIVTNGEVMSWDYENFQIDLIKCSSLQQMEFAKFYFSYGDLGAILGRFCNYHGVKIGHRGFWIDVYESTIYSEKQFDPTRNIGEVLLTIEPDKACEFLGLDYNVWSNGFGNLTEIFDWIKFQIFCSKNFCRIKLCSYEES